MESNGSITISQWNELSETEKEILRKWAVKQGYELELVPGKSGTFDPACDYAILLTSKQMVEFIKLYKGKLPILANEKVSVQSKISILWKEVKSIVEQHLENSTKL